MVYPVMHKAFLFTEKHVKIHSRAGKEDCKHEPGGVMSVERDLHRATLIPVFHFSNIPCRSMQLEWESGRT